MRQVFTRMVQGTRIVGQLVLVFIVVTICYDAIQRYAFAAPTSWSLEVNTFLLIYVAVMVAADVQRTDGHIRITFFVENAAPLIRRAARAVVALTGIAFAGILTWRGALMAEQAWDYGERVSSGFGTPMVLPYALLPLGFGTLALQFLFDLIDALWGDSPDQAG
ncbi:MULTISPECIES: TRAP transporter small permease [Rhodovulum]|uniref:TRAP transporter small permease protein n=1 Tax=Rhodovulum visakhapatnamense TaxID=364297 RepID=A0A4R8G8D7_9RHOB|nr:MULTISPECIES: TRAP transporter small permease [Rhodovulum]MBL3568614.1 TRAP transporter small permease [Rhodovulum visakhapatnamense]MBL3578498.1 TRAP transporter small permease [Rhodovulum visakhapatnamense]TDX33237.1 TRAP-type C4-dicarboxylate transport system permease small subunit [Rhodovulum visakhapatnamense]